MNVRIHEIVSRVSAAEGSAISDKTLHRIVAAVLEAVEAERQRNEQLTRELDPRGASGGARGGRR